MASLLEIRKKIRGVRNMKKITKAMQLVAASKMRQFQDRAEHSKLYIETLSTMLSHLLQEEVLSHPFTYAGQGNKTLFVLYTSDKGLCGSMNMQLMKGLASSSQWNALDSSRRDLITIGRKAEGFARMESITPVQSYTGLPEKFSTVDILPMVGRIIDLWMTGEYRHVYIMAPQYVNSFTFYPKLRLLLPFGADMMDSFSLEKDTVEEYGFSYFEPSKERVVENLFEQTFLAVMVNTLFELKATEYSSRMLAMKNATDAADKIIQQKTLVYNKIRQQIITQQIAEIVSAAEAVR